MSIKGFLAIIVIIVSIAMSCNPSPRNQEKKANTQLALLVGTYTGDGSDGIYRIDFDMETGILSNKVLVAETTNPSFFTISKDRSKVYAVNETRDGGVSSFKWNESHDKLELISKQKSQGDHPCYTELNADETLFTIANYSTGSILVYQIDEQGTISESPKFVQHVGRGTIPGRQDGPHAHCNKFSKDGKYLYAVDLGIDKVLKYPVDGKEIGESSIAFELDPADGPRQLIFHPTENLAFVINEQSSSVTSVKVDPESGNFTRINKLSTIPEDFEERNSCADIQISNDGKYVYASNRGHNSIAIFSSHEGLLSRKHIEKVRGEWPRNFTLTPDAENSYLVAANQKSDNITVFKRDAETGLLTFTKNEIAISKPVCVKF